MAAPFWLIPLAVTLWMVIWVYLGHRTGGTLAMQMRLVGALGLTISAWLIWWLMDGVSPHPPDVMQAASLNARESIVFLHGANAGAWMWEDVIKHLPGYHCVCLDLPGHGKRADMPWTSAEAVADEIADRVREHAPGSHAHIVGHSLGGYVALQMLARTPEVVGDLIVSGVPHQPLPNRWITRVLGVLVRPFIHNPALLRASLRAEHIPVELMDRYVLNTRLNSKQAFARINVQAPYFDVPTDALSRPNRKLFIAGQHEHPAVVGGLTEFAQIANNAASYRAERLGHAWIAQDPLLCAQVIASWLGGSALPEQLSPVHSSVSSSSG